MINETIPLPVTYRDKGIKNNNFQPLLTTYILSNHAEIKKLARRPLVLICPGGAYRYTSFRESEPVAVRMNALGFHAAVLQYSCAPMDFPAAFLDLCQAAACVRAHADSWGVDTDRIIICGFSAGGHLAACLGVWWNTGLVQQYISCTPQQIRPDALLLCYPVITSGPFAHEESIRNVTGMAEQLYAKVSLETQVTPDTPPAFIWHTAEDKSVPVQNSLSFVQALAQQNIPFEYHVFTKGRHGLSLASEQTANEPSHLQAECAVWPELFAAWVKSNLG